MERYALEAKARADEILDLLSEQERELLWEWVKIPDNIDFTDILMGPTSRIVTILGQTPSKDHRWQEKTDRPQFVREWLAARYWAIAAARSLQIAAELHHVPGLKYRQAVQSAAQTAARELDLADAEDLLFLRMLD